MPSNSEWRERDMMSLSLKLVAELGENKEILPCKMDRRLLK